MRILGSAFILGVLGIGVACGSSDDDGGAGGKPGAAGRGGASGAAGSTNSKAGKGGTSGASGEGTGGDAASTQGGSAGRSGRGGKGGTGGSGVGGSAQGGGGGSAANASGGAGDAGEPGQGGSMSTGGSGGDSGSGGDTVTGGTGGTSALGGGSGTAGAGGSAGSNPATSVAFAIDTTAGGHAISPLIYGINPESVACSNGSARFTLCRLGGDRWSTYNWENNASNAGAPLCFQNDGALAASDEPGEAVLDLLSEADASGAATLVTVPLLDYVAADKLGGTPPDECSGDVRKSGSDYLDTRFKTSAARKGAPFVTPPDTTDGAVYQDEFVAFVKAAASSSANVLFALDNQPSLWGITQEAVHPEHPTYAEVVDRNVAYAKMLRDQWPAAPIAGYVGYGWLDFVNLQYAPDADTLGLFVDYYLAGMADASATDTRRLIDYLDVHWFPEVYAGDPPTRIIDNVATPAAVAARVQNPRSLWDSTFAEDSWIAGGQALRLIPWLQERIAAKYPGTKLAISEWNYGGGADVSGAIAAADALGVFGREDVGFAAWKSIEHDDPFVVGAFRMFRNYDGAGAAFGDISLPATSSAIDLASVYASADSNVPGRVVIVAINRADHAVDAALSIDASISLTTAATYVLTSASPAPTAGAVLAATSPNAFSYTMPAYSVSVIVPAP